MQGETVMQGSRTQFVKEQFGASGRAASHRTIMFDDSRRLDFTASAGQVTTELLMIGDLGLTLGRVTSTGHEIELSENSKITFLLPARGVLDVLIRDREYRVLPDRPRIFRPTDRVTRATPVLRSRFRATTLQVSMDRMRRLAAACGQSIEQSLVGDASDLSDVSGQHLARHLPQLAEDLFRSPEMDVPSRVLDEISNLIDEQLCDLISVTGERAASKRTLPAFHRVRQAEELMRAHSDDPLSVLDLAQSLGVSLRSLQLAFKEVYDLGPRDVLNRIRLEKARHRLLAANGDHQVTTVALDCGFFHLSRFAQAYARAYGERPSETLARRRA